MRRDGSSELAVEIPPPGRDKPGWIRVGMIAAVGFVVGIAWPRIVGVRLGPSAPGEAAAAASASSGHGGAKAPEAPPASVTVKTPADPVASASAPASSAAPAAGAGAKAATSATSPPNITVHRGNVLSCKTSGGESKKGKECGGAPALDQVVSPRIRKIATCSGAAGQTGKLVVVANADFGSGRFSYDVGKSSTLGNIDAVAPCLKTAFRNTTVTSVAHEHTRYTVSYTAIFSPGSDASGLASLGKDEKPENGDQVDRKAKDAEPKPETPSASGESSVAWEVALVRDTPRTGQVVARLPRGTKVKVGSVKDGWYAIKYGEGLASDGWVYRGALGR